MMDLPRQRFAMDGAPAATAAPGGAVGAISNSISYSDAVAEMFGAPPSTTGPAVTDLTSLQVGTVYACLEKLGGAISQLPVHHYIADAAGERQRVLPNQPMWWLLNESPSPAWTATSWKEWIVRCVKLRGDQHTEILRNGGGAVVGLKVHHPDYVQVRTVAGRLRYDVVDMETGQAYGVDQDDMLHFTGFGFNGERSMSAIKWAARNAISNSLGFAEYMGKTVGEGGMPRMVLEFPNKLSPDSAKDIRTNFATIYGNNNGRKLPLVLSEGASAKGLSIDPVDLELLAARKMDKAEICEVLGVPPIIIGDSEKTSSWGTGVEQITLGWVRFSIQPMLCKWEEELNRKLFRRAGQFFEFSLAALLRGDTKTQAEAFRAALGGPGTGDGWLTVNEVRRLQNLPSINDAEYDKPFRAQRAVQTPAPQP